MRRQRDAAAVEARRVGLSKLLSWILRHGLMQFATSQNASESQSAEPRLTLFRRGFIAIEGPGGLCTLRRFSRYSIEEIISVASTSASTTPGRELSLRFECVAEQIENAAADRQLPRHFVRACYGHSIPATVLNATDLPEIFSVTCSESTGLTCQKSSDSVRQQLVHSAHSEGSLFRTALDTMVRNIKMFETFEGAPLHYVRLLEIVLAELKERHALTSQALRPFIFTEARTFDLRGCLVTTGMLQRIAKSCPNLREFQVTDDASVTDHYLGMLCTRCPALSTLVIEHGKYVTDVGLQTIAKCLPGLVCFFLSDNEAVTLDALLNLVGKTSLTMISLHRCTNLQPAQKCVDAIRSIRADLAVDFGGSLETFNGLN